MVILINLVTVTTTDSPQLDVNLLNNHLVVNIFKIINIKISSKMEFDQDQAVTYHYGKFPPAELDYSKLVKPLIEATDALARYDQMSKGLHDSEIVLAPLRDQEAITSSRIEGTISTMDEILRYAADNELVSAEKSLARHDIIETFLYRRALLNVQNAIEDGYTISGSLLKQAHAVLLSFGRGTSKSPGQYKTSQNYLADIQTKEILFAPISPERLKDGLETLFEYLNGSSHPVLIKTALAHVEFEALHPFTDGNGRIGRMLITLLLWNSRIISTPHFYVSRVLEENRDQYIDTMRNVSANGDWESWCIFFLEVVRKQANQNLEVAENISGLYEEMKGAFTDCLSSKWSINALDFIFKHPVYRNKQFLSDAGIPSVTAARITRILLKENLIVRIEEASGSKSALYSFEPLLKLVRV